MENKVSINCHNNSATNFICGPIFYKNNKNNQLLDGIRLDLTSPHLAVITGPSGCGKSTLLKAIAGLISAKVTIRQLNDKKYSEKDLAKWRTKVTLLPQDAPVVTGSVEENLTFPFHFKNSKRPFPKKEEMLALLDTFGLGHIGLNQEASSLSGGERHRLCLLRGLLWRPHVLLADEPLSGLEQNLAQRCFDIIKEFSHIHSKIVICTLHNESLAKQADSIWRLKNGKLYRA